MASRRVPFFDYPQLYGRDSEGTLSVMKDVLQRGAFILQKDLEGFEKELAEYAGAKHAFGVADGSNAITISLMASGVEAGDEVIVPSHTFIASAAAIHFAGATPVLADCGRDKMIDPDSIEPLITNKTRAIMPVQLNGRTADMDRIRAIADKHGLLIVEDSAQALGSKFRGQQAGTFGSAGTISFYPAKLLGCFGDGGAILTNDDKVARKVSMLRDHGRDPEGVIRCWGFNSRLDNLQAAVLSYKLKNFDQDVARRRDIASRYQSQLGDLSELLLPPAPDADERHFDVYQNYEIEAESRDELKEHLGENGVGTLIQWGGQALHQMTELKMEPKPAYTEEMFKRCLLLPMNTFISDDDVDYICESIRTFYKK